MGEGDTLEGKRRQDRKNSERACVKASKQAVRRKEMRTLEGKKGRQTGKGLREKPKRRKTRKRKGRGEIYSFFLGLKVFPQAEEWLPLAGS